MMAFQAGGPHAQDRGLEAVTYAWDQMRRVPAKSLWEKPQGKGLDAAMLMPGCGRGGAVQFMARAIDLRWRTLVF